MDFTKIENTGKILVFLPFGLIYFFQTMKFLMFFFPYGLISTLLALSISIVFLKYVMSMYSKVNPIFIMLIIGGTLWVINGWIYPNF